MSSVSTTAMATSAFASEGAHTQSIPASKLSVWCDRLIEAGWLAAIVVVPLFFDIYSSRVFEPDKLTTLRSIALFMAIVWLVKWVEELRNPNRDRSINLRTPLVLPTLVLVVVYLISTAFSVAPRTSLLGSYQRLQGTFTTFAYIIVFFMILQGLRTRVQLDRLLTVMIITSLPIAMYGLLQRLQLDPLPWGGDTTERVAGNMGNSIFIAAYLVMVFFITLYRISDSFTAIFTSKEPRWSDVVRAGAYILITLFNAIVVLILAGSRGPQLGWLGGVLFMALLFVQLIRRRNLRFGLTIAFVGVGVLGLLFLYFINATRDNPSLDALRQFPLFKRLSTVLTTTEGTNAVRVLIWKGAAELVSPHEPIQMPNGTPDQFNAIRPLIGYGPESMYVAYNRFYPPQLANIEARNASPDRSHNETWDSLVISGSVGFLAYMFLFGSVLFYGFRWIGLIASRFEAWLFPVLWIAGGALFGILVIVFGRVNLLGVAVAAGIVAGLTLFLFISAFINARRKDDEELAVRLSLRDQMLLIAIVSTVVAHFVEIHTGIAIAATRTNFWVLIAVMVVVGAGLLRDQYTAGESASLTQEAVATVAATPVQQSAPQNAPQLARATTGSRSGSAAGSAAMTRRQRRQQQAAAASTQRRQGSSSGSSSRSFVLPGWFGTVAAYGLFMGLILAIMAFDFTNNAERNTVPGQVFLNAMTTVKGQPSIGILLMFLVTLIVGTTIIIAELRSTDMLKSREQIVSASALVVSIALLIWITFGTFIAGRLVDFITTQANTVSGILSIADQLSQFPAYVYLLIAIVMVAGAFLLRSEEPTRPAKSMSAGGLATLLVGLPITMVTISTSNLQPIAADIVYKQANPWDQQASRVLQPGTPIQGWDLAIEHYRRAIQLAPNEDFYYLWLGRALLEKAKSTPAQVTTNVIPDNASFTKIISDEPQNWNRPAGSDLLPSATLSQDDLLTAARIILLEARVINPLNTDHSANLARMWRQSAEITTDPALKQQRNENSAKEYATATSLSPNNAGLWNEWGSLNLYSFGNLDAAQEKLDRSLALDQRFDQTYLLRAAVQLQRAAKLEPERSQADKDAATEANADWLEALSKARGELEQAIRVNPNATQAYQELTRIGIQLGDLQSAISATLAILKQSPNDWNSLKNLAVLYSDTQQVDLALDAAKHALELAPQDQQATLQAFVQQLSEPK